MTRNRISHQRTAAFVGDVIEFQVGIFSQQCHGQVTQTAVADGAKRHILFGLGRGHHIGKCFEFVAHIGRQYHGGSAHQDERHNVFLAVVGHVRYQALVHAVRVNYHRKGVAVSGCRQHAGSANHARCAAFVFDNNTLPQLLRKNGRNDSRYLVYRTARRKYSH